MANAFHVVFFCDLDSVDLEFGLLRVWVSFRTEHQLFGCIVHHVLNRHGVINWMRDGPPEKVEVLILETPYRQPVPLKKER